MNANSISLDQPLARGRTADVFDWENGYILKLFHNWFSLENIEYEMKIARAVHASGVKTPTVKELVTVQGRNGLVYERVRGESMLTLFQRNPWKVFGYARTLAHLHVQMHACSFTTDVPKQRARLQRKLRDADALSVLLKTALLKSLESLPDADNVCHGDFHPANILLTETDATVIDWIDASGGNPLADVARTSVILLGAAASSQVSNPLLKIFVRTFHAAYVREYFRRKPGGYDEYRRWLPIMAGARLSENITELESWLVKQAGG